MPGDQWVARLCCFLLYDWWETRFGQWVCERTYHKPGVVWFNAGYNDPDMDCKRCGKDLS